MNIKCSVCSSEINEKYCSKCGQFFKNEKITSISILKDLFGNMFSVEKSLLNNFKTVLFEPKKIILNYWNGFRGFYYSPSRFLVIAALFTLLQSIFSNDFLGIVVTSKVVPQFTILIINVLLMSFFSFIVYLKHKRTFYEHLVLNIYNVSIWTILFVPIIILLDLCRVGTTVEKLFFLPYHLLIMISNSRVFELSKLNRIVSIALNFVLLYGIIFLLKYVG